MGPKPQSVGIPISECSTESQSLERRTGSFTLSTKKSTSKKTAPGAVATWTRFRLIGPQKWRVSGTGSNPSISGERRITGSSNFGEVGDTVKEADTVEVVAIALGDVREGSDSVHETNIPNTVWGRKHVIESSDVKRSRDLTEKRAKDSEDVMVTEDENAGGDPTKVGSWNQSRDATKTTQYIYNPLAIQY
jgi:hypothetical protein